MSEKELLASIGLDENNVNNSVIGRRLLDAYFVLQEEKNQQIAKLQEQLDKLTKK